ncbi:MAG: YtfJ family protein [Hydrogenimonas sp.]|nr:YtfJ family protein [Hydrogenimonas sp.]
MKRVFLILLAALPLLALEVGQNLPTLSLEKDEGGRADGSSWSSDSLTGKVSAIFYVDPDKKSLNEKFTEALQSQKFDRKYYTSVAIVNMAATWMPNFAIEKALQSKQSKYPDTVYVKDRVKKGVKIWHVADDDVNFIVLSPKGVVLYARSGKIPEDEYEKIFDTIERSIETLR